MDFHAQEKGFSGFFDGFSVAHTAPLDFDVTLFSKTFPVNLAGINNFLGENQNMSPFFTSKSMRISSRVIFGSIAGYQTSKSEEKEDDFIKSTIGF